MSPFFPFVVLDYSNSWSLHSSSQPDANFLLDYYCLQTSTDTTTQQHSSQIHKVKSFFVDVERNCETRPGVDKVKPQVWFKYSLWID